ncbi:mCG146208, partial [Mus musculus]
SIGCCECNLEIRLLSIKGIIFDDDFNGPHQINWYNSRAKLSFHWGRRNCPTKQHAMLVANFSLLTSPMIWLCPMSGLLVAMITMQNICKYKQTWG